MRSRQPFVERLYGRMKEADSLLCVGLDPDPRKIPAPLQQAEDPIWAFNKWLIDLCAPYACAFKLNSAFYEVYGAQGWQALQRSIAFVPPEIPVILDAKHGDVGVSTDAYVRAAFDLLDVDAVTVNPYLGADAILPFAQSPERGVFVLCHTSNPGAAAVQGLLCSGEKLYERITELCISLNVNGNVGLVVGATYPEAVRRLRSLAPQMPFLVPGVGAQGGDLQAAVDAGLDAAGLGLIISASRAIMYDPRPDEAARRTRDAINTARATHPAPSEVHSFSACRYAGLSPLEELVLALHAHGCVQFGEFALHAGGTSPNYVDLRLLISFPLLLQQVAHAYTHLLSGLPCDRLAAIPYAAVPIASAVAMEMTYPMIYPRWEVKEYGTKRAIEGQYRQGERAVVLDDVISSGASKLKAIAPLEAAGLKVKDIVVLVDREQGGVEQLAQAGYQVHSVLKLSYIINVLERHGRITAEQAERNRIWLAEQRKKQENPLAGLSAKPAP